MRAVVDYDSEQGKILRIATFSIVCFAASMGSGPSLAAEPLGRLFFTPAQRTVLDAGKSLGKAAPVVPPPRNVELNGVVTRSDAGRTVWINGKAYHDKSPEGLQVLTNRFAPESTEILVKGREHAARIKVGQQLNLNAGTVREVPHAATGERVPEEAASTRLRTPAIGEGASPVADDRGRNTSAPAGR
jgi:hypothetical protein